MTTVGTEQSTTQVYRVHIRASPQAVWDAITQPEWNARYGYGGRGEYDLRLGGKYRVLASEEQKKGGEEMGFPTPDVVVDGEVIEAQAPHRLVQTWRMDMDPEMIARRGIHPAELRDQGGPARRYPADCHPRPPERSASGRPDGRGLRGHGRRRGRLELDSQRSQDTPRDGPAAGRLRLVGGLSRRGEGPSRRDSEAG